jgi:hypothetical protein
LSYGKNGITARDLSDKLSAFDIRPRQIRLKRDETPPGWDGKAAGIAGYRQRWFTDVWERYLPPRNPHHENEESEPTRKGLYIIYMPGQRRFSFSIRGGRVEDETWPLTCGVDV